MVNRVRTCNLSDVILGDPAVPVVHQSAVSRVVILVLAEGPLVDNPVVSSGFKEGWLKDVSVHVKIHAPLDDRRKVKKRDDLR